MIILGSEYIPYPQFSFITNIENIKTTPSRSNLFFSFDLEVMDYCSKNDIPYSVFVDDVTQAIYANSLHAQFIFIYDLQTASKIQKIAENYMFDSKIIYIIQDDTHIEEVANQGIDGVIFNSILQGFQNERDY